MDAGALKKAGNAALQQDDVAEAVRLYRKGLDASPHEEESLALHLNLAHGLNKLEEFAGAVEHAGSALALDPSNTKGLFRRATALRALARLDEAEADLATLLELEPKNPAGQRLRQEVKRELNAAAKERSKGLFGGVLEKERESAGKVPKPAGPKPAPKSAEAIAEEKKVKADAHRAEDVARLREQGRSAHRVADYAKAEAAFSAALMLVPDDATLLNNRAAARMMLEKFREALADAQRVHELDPTNVKAWVRGSKCLLRLGDVDGAESCCSRGMAHAGAEGGYELAAQVQACREAKRAYREVEELVDEVPGSRDDGVRALALLDAHGLAASSLRLRALVLAQQKGEEALELAEADRSPDAQLLRGLALLICGERKKATDVLKAKEDCSRCQDVVTQLEEADEHKVAGNIALRLNKPQDAVEAYEKSLASAGPDPKLRAVVLTNLATAWRQLRRPQDALRRVNEAIKVDPTYAKATFRRGVLGLDEGRWRQAAHDFEKVEEICPNMQGLGLWKKRARACLQPDRSNHYKELGILCDAGGSEIKKQFRLLARECHPDKLVDCEDKQAAEERFKRINEAYEVLSDAQKRQEYDYGAEPQFGFPSGFGGFGGGGGGHPFFGGGGGHPFGGGGGHPGFRSNF